MTEKSKPILQITIPWRIYIKLTFLQSEHWMDEIVSEKQVKIAELIRLNFPGI